ncbi:MAG: Rpn family recombination-promoting nuclease/putative transposase [Blautia sp.]|nr:Rpn family recombination-promoting nuclease/putative transposase [Blautia sp.]
MIYYMIEAQASPNPNIPYRLLEYITAGLRGLIESEDMLYRNKMVVLRNTGTKSCSGMP